MTDRTELLNNMIARQTAYVADLETLLADTPDLLVLQFATNGMCVNTDGEKPVVTNVLNATRFPVDIMRTGAPKVYNGAGEVAVLTTLRAAAEYCHKQSKDCVAFLEKTLAE